MNEQTFIGSRKLMIFVLVYLFVVFTVAKIVKSDDRLIENDEIETLSEESNTEEDGIEEILEANIIDEVITEDVNMDEEYENVGFEEPFVSAGEDLLIEESKYTLQEHGEYEQDVEMQDSFEEGDEECVLDYYVIDEEKNEPFVGDTDLSYNDAMMRYKKMLEEYGKDASGGLSNYDLLYGFAIVYIDDNDIPDFVVCGEDTSYEEYDKHTFSVYLNGKYNSGVRFSESFKIQFLTLSYYEKTGVYEFSHDWISSQSDISGVSSDHVSTYDRTYLNKQKMSNWSDFKYDKTILKEYGPERTELQEEEYWDLLYKMVGDSEQKQIDFLENNEENRNKYFTSKPTIYSDNVTLYISEELEKTSLENFEDYLTSISSTSYDPKLSYMLSAFSNAAYNERWVKDSLISMGFSSSNIITDYRDDYTVAYTLAKKTLSDGSLLVMVIIRGSYDKDWTSNAYFGSSALMGLGKHAGYENDASEIYAALSSFLGGIKYDNVKYVITGHSQGAAAANLLSVKLYDAGVPSSIVYDYNYACPNVACLINPDDWNPNGVHNNIYNINNIEDPVSFLPSNYIHKFNPLGILSTWGKFGRSYWFAPNKENRSPGGITGHDLKYYIKALSYHAPIEAFATYGQMVESYINKAANVFYELFVRCPVDVEVIDAYGNTAVKIVNNEVAYIVDENIIVTIENDEKWILIPANEKDNYSVRLVGTDAGTMTYEVYKAKVLAEESKGIKYDSVKLEAGKEMSSIIDKEDIKEIKLEVVDHNQNVIAEVQTDGSEKEIDPTPSPTVKKKQTMTVKTRTPLLKVKKIKKKNQVIKRKKVFTIKKARGKISFVKESGPKGIIINRNGDIIVKKGTKTYMTYLLLALYQNY